MLALSACTPPNDSNSQKTPVTKDAQTEITPSSKIERVVAVLARLPDAEAGDAAALIGTLAIQSGCLVLESGGDTLLIAVTHKNIRWDGTRLMAPDGDRKSVV